MTKITKKQKLQAKVTVLWQLVLLGSQSLASYKLYHGVSSKPELGVTDYVVIIAATALAISVAFRVARLITNESKPTEL